MDVDGGLVGIELVAHPHLVSHLYLAVLRSIDQVPAVTNDRRHHIFQRAIATLHNKWQHE